MGVLEWPPARFWSATPHDLFAALDGWNEKNGNNKGKARSSLSRRDLKRLRRMLDEAR